MTSCLSWQEGESGKKNNRCVFRRNRRNRNKSRMCTRFHQERDNNRVDRDNNRCLRSRWWSSLRNLRDWTWRCFPDMNRHSRQCTARHRRHNRFSWPFRRRDKEKRSCIDNERDNSIRKCSGRHGHNVRQRLWEPDSRKPCDKVCFRTCRRHLGITVRRVEIPGRPSASRAEKWFWQQHFRHNNIPCQPSLITRTYTWLSPPHDNFFSTL